MNTSTIVSIVVVILVVLGGWYWYSTYGIPIALAPQTTDTTQESGMPVPPENGTAPVADVEVNIDVSTAPTSATITYNEGGFSSSEVTIKKGGTVTWRNESGGSMWVASAMHPTHSVYAGIARETHCPDTTGVAFDQCATGNSYSFTFNKVGTWKYHNHLNASHFGSVVVVE